MLNRNEAIKKPFIDVDAIKQQRDKIIKGSKIIKK